MTTKCIVPIRASFLIAWLSSTLSPNAQAHAFIYQGRLIEQGAPAHGSFELRLTAHDALTAGTIVAGPLTNSEVVVSNGLFSVTIDFGPGTFAGAARWLEIAVRTNGSLADFEVLAPRQPIAAVPYALHAFSAPSVTTLPSDSLLSPTTIFVDSANGRDDTARRETGLPFKSVSNALAAALSGDVIHIRQGRYTNALNYYPLNSYSFHFTDKTNLTVRATAPEQ